MIIKGKSCSHSAELARHLMRTDHNDNIQILELDECSAAPTLEAAFREYQALAEGLTNAQHGLYETSLSPRNDENLTPAQWEKAVDMLAEELGLTGQPRVVILHEKRGREHVHAVFQRTDVDEQKVISDSYNYPAHEQAARAIELEFGLEITQGVHTREKDEERPLADYSHDEAQQAQRSGIDPINFKEKITDLYEQAETGREFIQALERNGCYLARGERKNIFMVIDEQREAHSLTRSVEGHRKTQIEDKLYPLTTSDFNTVPEVKEALIVQEHAREEIQKLQSKQMKETEELQNQQSLEIDRMAAHHAMDSHAARAAYEDNQATGIVGAFFKAMGISWYLQKVRTADERKIIGEQTQELQDLKREHLNQRTDLIRDQRQEWHRFDQENKPDFGHFARFELSPSESRLNIVQERVEALKTLDQNDQYYFEICQELKGMYASKAEVEFQRNYLETLEHSVKGDFQTIYKDGEKAMANFLKMVEDKNTRKAVKILKNRPAEFGELNPISLKEMQNRIETAATDGSKSHYLRAKIESGGVGKTRYGRVWRINELQEKKLRIESAFTDEKLGALRQLQIAGNELEAKEWKALTTEAKHHITLARNIMKDTAKREVADRVLKESEQERRNELQRLREKEHNPDEPER